MERAADMIMSGKHPQCIWCGEKGQGSDYTSIGGTAWCQGASITRSETSVRVSERGGRAGRGDSICSEEGHLDPDQAKHNIKEKNVKIKEIC